MTTLKEKVLVEREVPRQIADLVNFAKWLASSTGSVAIDDDRLIAIARTWYEREHGEDD